MPDANVVYQGLLASNGAIDSMAYLTTLTMPMMFGRQYVGIRIGTCDSSHLVSWEVLSVDSTDCFDRYARTTVSWPMADSSLFVLREALPYDVA